MTAQEIFDTVVTRLRAQGAPAMDYSVCKYRAPGGRKCAAGHLIPDCLYDSRMEGNFIGTVCGEFPALRPYLLATDLSEDRAVVLISNLQTAHDQGGLFNKHASDEAWLATFLDRARQIAADFGLNPKEAV